ncbi:MAG TPA: hypothetical protein DCY97_21050 [Marinilabiliales bacterium]|nr:hypothetical protein [Marinilabiliales bacterium]
MLNFKSKRTYVVLFFVFIIITVIADFVRNESVKPFPQRPDKKIEKKLDQIYLSLINGEEHVWKDMDTTLEYINSQYDCSDFDLVNLIRIIYEYGDKIPKETKSKIDSTLLNFRYWWDEPGENSMCYWSENHQILFTSAEYLAGQKYSDIVFPNSGLTGKEHMEKARKRALDWMEMRWKYGFIEYYSNVYYIEDIGGMINMIDFADEEISKKMQIIMDLLLYDVAVQNIKTMFISVSGRAYEGNRKGGRKATLGGITNYYWGNGEKISRGMMYGMMATKKYSLPPVIAEIAKDTGNVVVKQSNGLDISEMKAEGYFGTDNRSMMMQWGMEAFSNPEVVRNSLFTIRKNKMFSNSFLSDFTLLNYSVLRWLHLEPLLVRILNPQSNGVAIQKGNTYTYKTKDYSLYSVQNHHPGTYGDQQHVSGMTVENSFSIFHCHPALEKDKKNQSPNYWVGYGHLPHVAQDENVSLAIYNIPEKRSIMEMAVLDYTHAYFPKEQFDTVVISNNYAFGKKENTYCVFIGRNQITYRENTTDDLIQKGKQTFWITEAGSKDEDGLFGEFCKRIQGNSLTFNPRHLELTYLSKGKKYNLTFGSDFLINDQVINTEYDRYDSPYIKAAKKAETLTFDFKGKSLYLDFYKMERIYKDEK